MKYSFLFVNDLHAGSVFGMLPPKFESSSGGDIGQNAGQRHLWNCWEDLTKQMADTKLDGVIVDGDAIDGPQQKNHGQECCLPDLNDQEGAAHASLSFLRKKIESGVSGKVPFYFVQGCVTPGHRILTSDLNWTLVENLSVGDEILTVAEEPGVSGRQWRVGKVTASVPLKKECMEIGLSDGTKLIATEDHPWLIHPSLTASQWEWVQTQKLTPGMIMSRVISTWPKNQDYDTGYIAGFFDGEGILTQGQPAGSYGNRLLIEAGQVEGNVLKNVTNLLQKAGVIFNIYANKRDTLKTIHIIGGTPETLKFLGTFRPVRLLAKFNPNLLNRIRAVSNHTIKYIKPIGKQTVIGLSTSEKTYIVEGFGSHNTEYHDGRGAENFENIAQKMGGVKYAGLGTGRYSKEVLDLDVDGVIINVAHQIGGGSGITRGNSLDKEMIMSALAGKMGKFPKADLVVRAHLHFFCHVEHASKHGFIAPCWQLQTRFMRHNSAYRMTPDIGAVVAHIDSGAKKLGHDPVWVEKFLYPLPERKPTAFVK